MAREAWTDERLDDLAHRMDLGFGELREDTREFRREVKAEFEKVDAKLEKLDTKFDGKFEALNGRFDSLQRWMIGTLVTIVIAEVLSRF